MLSLVFSKRATLLILTFPCRMKLKENLTAFAVETSIHGLKYIAKSPSKSVRIAWFLIFLASLSYAFFQISYEAKCK